MPSQVWDAEGNPRVTNDGGRPSTRRHASIATYAALVSLAAAASERVHGNEMLVEEDQSRWYFHESSTIADTSGNLVRTPLYGDGRWLRVPGTIDLRLPFTFNTADAAALLTVPSGARLIIRRGRWVITTAMTGGSSSAIGASASVSPHTTKGDLHGGSSGDVEATLTVGERLGTIGTDTAAGVLLTSAAVIRFDRITSAFAAGVGEVRFVADLITNAGA